MQQPTGQEALQAMDTIMQTCNLGQMLATGLLVS